MDRGSFFKQAFSALKNGIVLKPEENAAKSVTAFPEEPHITVGLTEMELSYCHKAGLSPETGQRLKSLTLRPLEKLVFEDFDTKTAKPTGISSLTNEENARMIVKEHREDYINSERFIFICDIEVSGFRVGVLGASTDPYEIIRLNGTNGINFNVMPEDIIEKYKKWDDEFGIRIIGIGKDFCECEIIKRDIDYSLIAKEVYEFCPDVVDQGTGTVELLEDEIRNTGSIFLWWD